MLAKWNRASVARWITTAVAGVLVAAAVQLSVGSAGARQRTHRVRKGQLLGSIARMYGVPTAALCRANGINCRRPLIKPGQRLIIPSAADRDGSRAAASRKRGRSRSGGKKPAADRARASSKKPPQGWHRVRKGQLLGSIAKQYGVATEALCRANNINCARPLIRPGQRLIIPNRRDADGSSARRVRHTHGGADSGRAGKSGQLRSAANRGKRGYVVLRRGDRKWAGYATRRGSVTRAAKRGFKTVLSTRDGRGTTIHPRLIQLIAKVSQHFGGNTIEVVSGYRTTKAGKGSRHRKGRAIDFRVQGVSTKKVLAYIKTFQRVGVGYYPNSGFVHLDVRTTWTHWIDYAGPGQPARYAGFWTRKSK